MKIRALLTERSLNIKAFYSKEVTRLEGCELGNIVYNIRSSKNKSSFEFREPTSFCFQHKKIWSSEIICNKHRRQISRADQFPGHANAACLKLQHDNRAVTSFPLTDLGSFACNAQRMVLVTWKTPPLSRLGSMFVLLAGRMLTADQLGRYQQPNQTCRVPCTGWLANLLPDKRTNRMGVVRA